MKRGSSIALFALLGFLLLLHTALGALTLFGMALATL